MFWAFMCMFSLLVPILMVVAGGIMLYRPPKNINGIYGYRTARSMKNMDTWGFAHSFCGRLWIRIGRWLLVFSAFVQIPLFGRSDDVTGTVDGILCILQCAVLVGSIFPVERALRVNFTEDGERRHTGGRKD